jgi:pimeloyl-ACP methyl ester carboxylesterase
VIGDEPHWDDAARDTIHLINTFQEEMPPPIIAIGQSFGGYPVMQAALMHPRLFTALVALEPSIASRASSKSGGSNYHGATALAMAKRRDTWESREAARIALLKNPYFAAFDPEVFEKVMKHDLRDAPTAECPRAVTLTTPKALEAGSLLRPDPPPTATGSERDPDFVPGTAAVLPGFYRTEPDRIQYKLQYLRPPVLYIFGTKSKMSYNGVFLQGLVEATGTGRGGSGGAAAGMVEGVWVEGESILPLVDLQGILTDLRV